LNAKDKKNTRNQQSLVGLGLCQIKYYPVDNPILAIKSGKAKDDSNGRKRSEDQNKVIIKIKLSLDVLCEYCQR